MSKRIPSVTEEAAITVMYTRKAEHHPPRGYVTAARHPDRIIPAGQTLKIVMVSRMGDCGLSDDLAADYGYHVRFDWDDDHLSDIRLHEAKSP